MHSEPPAPPFPTGDNPPPWRKFSSERGADLLLFKTRWDLLENPRTSARMKRLVLETRDWVNVVAFTPQGELVVVRQFRFGAARVTTEIPGGVVDPGEDPLQAAQRELREETGFTGGEWSSLGAVEPNPAFHDNLCYHFLARGVHSTHRQELDGGEDIRAGLLSRDALRASIASGEINHALVISALSRVMDLSGLHPTET